MQEWTAAGQHSTSLMGGAGQGLVQGRACTLSSGAHRGHLQRAEPGTGVPPRARTRPHPGVGTMGRLVGEPVRPQREAGAKPGRVTARPGTAARSPARPGTAAYGGPLLGVAKVGVPGSGCLCLRHPQSNICQRRLNICPHQGGAGPAVKVPREPWPQGRGTERGPSSQPPRTAEMAEGAPSDHTLGQLTLLPSASLPGARGLPILPQGDSQPRLNTCSRSCLLSVCLPVRATTAHSPWVHTCPRSMAKYGPWEQTPHRTGVPAVPCPPRNQHPHHPTILRGAAPHLLRAGAGAS